MSRKLLLDANLLVLFCVGCADRRYIQLHKRLGAYTRADFELLLEFIENYDGLLVTPNTFTEASNLALQIKEPARSDISHCLAAFADIEMEEYVPSKQVVKRQEYAFLGLSDTAQLELSTPCDLLTADAKLYLAAVHSGQTAYNFTHLREHAKVL